MVSTPKAVLWRLALNITFIYVEKRWHNEYFLTKTRFLSGRCTTFTIFSIQDTIQKKSRFYNDFRTILNWYNLITRIKRKKAHIAKYYVPHKETEIFCPKKTYQSITKIQKKLTSTFITIVKLFLMKNLRTEHKDQLLRSHTYWNTMAAIHQTYQTEISEHPAYSTDLPPIEKNEFRLEGNYYKDEGGCWNSES